LKAYGIASGVDITILEHSGRDDIPKILFHDIQQEAKILFVQYCDESLQIAFPSGQPIRVHHNSSKSDNLIPLFSISLQIAS
jgi:hypothetical protein